MILSLLLTSFAANTFIYLISSLFAYLYNLMNILHCSFVMTTMQVCWHATCKRCDYCCCFCVQGELTEAMNACKVALDVSTDQREIQLICLHEIGEQEKFIATLTPIIVTVLVKMLCSFEYMCGLSQMIDKRSEIL